MWMKGSEDIMECNKDCKDCTCECTYDDNCADCQMCSTDTNHG